MHMNEFLQNASAIAREAGQILREGYGNPGEITYKGISDIVTHYDRKSEHHITAFLHNKYPEHSIRAEESGLSGNQDSAKYEWLIDPLDGTTNFAHSFPFFAVSISVLENNQPIVGVVYDPMRDEIFTATSRGPATMNGETIHVTATSKLEDSLLATGFPYDMHTQESNNLTEFGTLIYKSQGIRRAGAAALDLCYTACGRLDAFWEIELQPWDMAAGALIVQASGGTLTDISGNPKWFPSKSIVASNGIIHQELLDCLQAQRR